MLLWKTALSRNLPILRFFACPKSPSSRGVYKWFTENYEELKQLNPDMPLLLRTTPNAMPAITTELSFTVNDLLRYMLKSRKFRDEDGTISEVREAAARAYLENDWALLRKERWSSPGFDPERPNLEEIHPMWRDDPKISSDLEVYLSIKDAVDEQIKIFQSGPNDEYRRAENALLMCQRVDLWCAGPSEVEAAVKHLSELGKRFNDLETEYPDYITEFYPGAGDLD